MSATPPATTKVNPLTHIGTGEPPDDRKNEPQYELDFIDGFIEEKPFADGRTAHHIAVKAHKRSSERCAGS
jgi:hypothetical protein